MRFLACFLALALLAVPACGLSTEGTAGTAGDGSPADGTVPSDAKAPVDGTTNDVTKPDGNVPEGGQDAPLPVDASPDSAADSSSDAPADAPLEGSGDARADAPPPPPDSGMDACVSGGMEICTDGIDNNCNGLIDCADPMCATQGYACVPPSPGGWSYVTVDLTGRPACPAGAGAPVSLVLDPVHNPASCPCSCNATQSPSCTTGTLAATYGNDATCSNGPDPYPVNGGACVNLMGAVGILTYAGAAVLPPQGAVACGASASTNVPPNGTTQGEACPVAGPFGGGCQAGDVCGLVGASPFRACVRQAGSTMCPAGYQVPHAAGSSLTDTRGCSTCTCGAPPTASCTGATWTFYQQMDCGGSGPDVLTVDGHCDVSNADPAAIYRSYRYTATVNVNCGAPTQQSGPTGSLTLSNPETVCCAQ